MRFDKRMLLTFDFPSKIYLTKGCCLLLIFPQKLSQVPVGYALCGMFVLPCLDKLKGVKRAITFVQKFNFDPGRSIKGTIKQNRKIVFFKYGEFYPSRSSHHLYRFKS